MNQHVFPLIRTPSPCRKYKIISHPSNSNPFQGTFLNFRSFLQLREITRGNMAYMEWEGSFDTDFQVGHRTLFLDHIKCTKLHLSLLSFA